MSDRIRELEVALEAMQSKSSSSSHPLLSPDHLLIKNHMELYTSDPSSGSGQKSSNEANTEPEDDDCMSTSTIREETSEKETFFGHTARLEVYNLSYSG